MKRFPDEFFEQMYRLHGWEYKPGTSQRTPQAGKLVNKYIYDQLAPGVREEMERLNPKNEKGNRSHKHRQHLTDGTGLTALDRQISTVTTLMRISENREHFEELFNRAYPPRQARLPLVLDVDYA
ncbi:P63C domain-containing protein [Nesterenkonia ebinurensis]|uniref:P63C domain-containing protein n=1 Tax=Nesterenkonia ebinurensis TaxID=2608252 RepID=UPI00123E1491|nr:P63C domain-containing protein [Nesterenkonia ebinurensis]